MVFVTVGALPGCFQFKPIQFSCEEGGTGKNACDPGSVCIDQTCFRVCSQTSDCDDGSTIACVSSTCREFVGSCLSDDQCPSEWFCNLAGNCERRRVDESQCLTGSECRNGRCLDTVCEANDGPCPAGYLDVETDGSVCIDINECDSGIDNCDLLVTCTNGSGSFSCGTCPQGYTDIGDGTLCTDIDECDLGLDNCAPGVACNNSPGEFVCGSCPSGFNDVNGDGSQCDDIDECTLNLDNCDPLAGCMNESGTFSCGSCPSGYTDPTNGTSCVPTILGLNPSVIGLSPSFSSLLQNYNLNIGLEAQSITFTTSLPLGASLTVAGMVTASDVSSAPLPMLLGNNIVELVVSAGTNSRTYTVDVFRGLANFFYLKDPTPDTFGEFGNAVSIDDFYLTAGQAPDDLVHTFELDGGVWSWDGALGRCTSTTGTMSFGSSLSLSDTTLVIGASRDRSSTSGISSSPGGTCGIVEASVGSAHVYVRSGAAWAHQSYIKASNAQGGDAFGTSVALDGDTLVVGAPGEDSNATEVGGSQGNESAPGSGAAYVFVRNGSSWSQQAYLKASNTDASDAFGSSVAVSGDYVVVGSPGANSAVGGSGAAYIYVRSGVTWTFQALLSASNAQASDGFGSSVAIDGATVVVGAPFEASSSTGVDGNGGDNSAPNSGAAYGFTRSGTNWTQAGYLKASNTGAGDLFGTSVSISGSVVVIGAPLEGSNATGVFGDGFNNMADGAGATYRFETIGQWSQDRYIKASNTEPDDRFGSSVAIDGSVIVVGAIGEDGGDGGVNGDDADNTRSFSGAVYVY